MKKLLLLFVYFTLYSSIFFAQTSTSAPETLTNNVNSTQGIILEPTSTFTPNLNSGNNDLVIRTSGTNSRTQLTVVPSGSNKSAFLQVANASDPNNAGVARLGARGEYAVFAMTKRGTGSAIKHFAIELDNISEHTDEAFLVTSNGFNSTGTPDILCKIHNSGLETIEAKVQALVAAPDYVFKDDYNLRSLDEVENYIKIHSHLPEIPSAAEFKKDGIKLGAMSFDLLKKIEELTLYMIELKKDNKVLKERLERLEESN